MIAVMEKKIKPGSQIVIDVLKSGGNIYDLARKLNLTIAVTSELVANLSNKNEKLAEKFKDWPKNLTKGHIFIGDKNETYGERGHNLKKGDHVLVSRRDKLLTKKEKKDRWVEIYRPIIETEHKYDLCLKIDKKDLEEHNRDKRKSKIDFYKIKEQYYRVVQGIWLTKEEAENLDIFNLGFHAMMKTPETRQKLSHGQWLGVVNVRSIVNVNHNWLA